VPALRLDVLFELASASASCNVQAFVDATASDSRNILSPITFDTATELNMLKQYFSGDTTPYRLSQQEFAQAQQYVRQFPDAVEAHPFASRGEYTARHIYFGLHASSAPSLDALMGTALGIFRGNQLIGIRDAFNFDEKDRGILSPLINMAIRRARAKAAQCSGNVTIPIVGGVVR
jgi:hypothetical protein